MCCEINSEFISAIGEVLTGIAALIGVFYAGNEYRNKNIFERSKWLQQLHQKFYEEKHYKKIRDILDEPREIKKFEKILINEMEQDGRSPEGFSDYLNFFEFIAILEKKEQLNLEEIDDLFGYYLKNIKDNKIIIKYLNKYSFENLVMLLEKIKAS